MWFYAISLVIAGSLLFRICHNNDGIVLHYHTFAVLLDLGIGGLTAYLIKSSKKVRMAFENTSTKSHLVLFILSFWLVAWNACIFNFEYGPAIGRLFVSLSFAIIIASQALTKSTSKLNLGSFSFANKWGRYTYGIYLLHPIVLTLLEVVCKIVHISIENVFVIFIKASLGLVLTLIISKLSYTYFESFFLRLKSKYEIVKTYL